jgi:uncharacterized membrane protein YuzA (DUF378 family)
MTKRDDRPSDSAVADFSFRRLPHDILVNVIANLIAAAIIYLFGAVVGLLPSEPRAILVAAGFLTIVLGLLTLAVGKTYSLSKKQQKRDVSVLLFTVSIFLVGLGTILAALFPDVLPWWERIGYIIMGLACLLLSYLGFWAVRKTRQIRQR